MVKNLPAMQKTGDSVPGLGRSLGGGNGNPLRYSCGQRSLVGYSPWGHKESDTTEQLNNNNNLTFMIVIVKSGTAKGTKVTEKLAKV